MKKLFAMVVLAATLNAYDPIHLQKALAEKECIQCDLRGANLSKNDFSGGDFRETKSWKANFTHTILFKTNLSDAELGDATFIGNDLQSSNINNTLLWQTHFNATLMRHTQCTHAKKEKALLDTNITCR